MEPKALKFGSCKDYRLKQSAVIRAACSALAASLLCACSLVAPKFEKPRLALTGIQMLDADLFQQNFVAHLRVQNPNDRTLPVDGIDLQLSLEGERVASGVSDKAFAVGPFGEADFDMIVSANMAAGLLKLAKKAKRDGGAVEYQLDGTVNLDLTFMRSLPFHERGSFDLQGLRLH